MKEILLLGKSLCKAFTQNGVSTAILDKIDIEIYQHGFTVIMGASGAGKSTLLYALSGMDSITNGEIIYSGERISDFPEDKMARLCSREFGFVFQQTHLVSNLTLYENMAVAGYVSKKRPPQETADRASTLLEQMHIGSARDRLPNQVSGGEAQRAAIARAMINEPGLLFADEPTGAFNKSSSEDVLDLLSQLNRAGQSILMVTRDVRAALRGKRILYLEDGKILDELALPVYDSSQSRERETQINTWPGLFGIISAMQALLVFMYFMVTVFILIVTVMTGSRILAAEQRNIGIYKSSGFTDRQLRLSFALRFGMTATFGGLLGTVFAVAFTDALVSSTMKLAGMK